MEEMQGKLDELLEREREAEATLEKAAEDKDKIEKERAALGGELAEEVAKLKKMETKENASWALLQVIMAREEKTKKLAAEHGSCNKPVPPPRPSRKRTRPETPGLRATSASRSSQPSSSSGKGAYVE